MPSPVSIWTAFPQACHGCASSSHKMLAKGTVHMTTWFAIKWAFAQALDKEDRNTVLKCRAAAHKEVMTSRMSNMSHVVMQG